MVEQAEIERDVVVVGGGAAGLSAALILGRSRRRVTVLDAGAPRNAPAQAVHGLLALGLSPLEFLRRGRDEVTGYGGEIIVDDRLTGVRLDDDKVIPVETVAVAPRMVARAEAFAGIGITATQHPVGSFAADETGRTSVPGVWAAGNSTDLSAQVGAAAAGGARAAAHLNADLVAEDTDRAVARLTDEENLR
ncbi:FAD-dependent oxidoreductase [Micromonospora sp. DT15]|uniref:FAD-dependent oxidoreductase n=1 Tax=Micromonospora sp. DT15 TaxID=3393445 RepID=UPI003CEAAC87